VLLSAVDDISPIIKNNMNAGPMRNCVGVLIAFIHAATPATLPPAPSGPSPILFGDANLTAANYSDITKKKGDTVSVVVFTAAWCTHCRPLEEQYAMVSSNLTVLREAAQHETTAASGDELGPIPGFYRVDMSGRQSTGAEKRLADELYSTHKITDLPTIRLFREGHMLPYEQTHTATAILRWIQKQRMPPVEAIKSEAAMDEWVEKAAEAEVPESTPLLPPSLPPLPTTYAGRWRA